MTFNATELTEERNSTHGDFEDNAELSQELKDLMHASLNWGRLSPVMREALEMIALKISRALTGNYREIDHWKDMAGYATLVVQRLEKESTAKPFGGFGGGIAPADAGAGGGGAGSVRMHEWDNGYGPVRDG